MHEVCVLSVCVYAKWFNQNNELVLTELKNESKKLMLTELKNIYVYIKKNVNHVRNISYTKFIENRDYIEP